MGFFGPSAAAVSPVWTTYAMAIVATSDPIKGAIIEDIARFWVEGKILHLNYYLFTLSAGTAGVSTYRFPLPAGFTIDVALAPTAPVQDQGADPVGCNLGPAFASEAPTEGAGFVTCGDTTHVLMAIENAGVMNWVGDANYNLAAETCYAFDAKIPIL